ncbi:MAG: hypothetical protein R2712_04385 [Vicinamibacterales bacterium]
MVRAGALNDDRIDAGDLVGVRFAEVVHAPPASISVDAGRASAVVVGPHGGSVAVTSAEGTVFTLDIPAGALSRPTDITLTPVISITGAPGGLQHVRGAGDAGRLQFAVLSWPHSR